ncbi:MAG: MerR family transcriptional regulator [Frankiales bacterium]|nr:MerR family transcriptional regulator [Frankiales bacterium]
MTTLLVPVLVRTGWLSPDALARQTGVHPDLIRRFVALGLLDPEPGQAGALHFRQRDVARVLRAQRLRAALGLNYASLGLVLDLLDRVAALEATQRHPARTRRRSDSP